MSSVIIRYYWDFGDGSTSSERSPTHVYPSPGVYTVSLTVTFGSGQTYTTVKEQYVTVSDFDYGGSFDVSNTDKCYRAAVLSTQGKGITKFTGTDWIWPTAYTGSFKGFTASGEAITIICDNRTGRFYRIGVPEVWTDKTNDYGGTDIVSKIKLKERTAAAGEYQEIEHVESHIHLRPWKETNRSASGFGSDGFLTGHSVDIQFYENGEPTTPSTKLEDVSRYGDYVARIRLEARRIQVEYIFATAAWRVIKTQERYMPIDKAAGPALDYPSEQEWQDDFASPVLWLSRDRLRPILNRATGADFTGSYDQLTTGPDGQSNSAVAMGITDSLTTTISDLTGDFTISLWLYGVPAITSTILQFSTGSLEIRITGLATRSVHISDGVNGWSVEMAWTSGWVHLSIVRDGDTLRIYENGVSLYSAAMVDSSVTYGGTVILSDNVVATLFDAIIVQRVISSAALIYYYNQVIDNGEQCPFLPILR